MFFAFSFKKVLKVLNVTSLQYVPSVLMFSYVSIPAPRVHRSPFCCCWLVVNAKNFRKEQGAMCGHRRAPHRGTLLFISPPLTNSHRSSSGLKISTIGVPPLESYKLLSQKDVTKRQIRNPWGTFKHEVFSIHVITCMRSSHSQLNETKVLKPPSPWHLARAARED